MNMNSEQKETIKTEKTVYIDDREFTVVSIFGGTKSSSELLCDLAVRQFLYADNLKI